jgi:hypothetical protein
VKAVQELSASNEEKIQKILSLEQEIALLKSSNEILAGRVEQIETYLKIKQ